jgi:hypothetical protein
LTWASSQSGSVPCGGSLTAGSLTSAQYMSSYAYDTLDRLSSSPAGSYTYGNCSHLDAVNAIGSNLYCQLRCGGQHDLPRADQRDDV